MATMDVAAIALVDRRLNDMVGTLALGWNARRVSVNAEKKSVLLLLCLAEGSK
jgi:hypothetical protein